MIHIVLLLIHGTVDIDIHRYLHRGMSQNLRQGFAVQPLLPGVAQLDWVMHYAAALASGYRFHSIQNVKFAAPLLPENTVTLLLAWQPEREMLTFSYQRHAGNERHTASSGKIRLCQ